MFKRKNTRKINVGGVIIGGNAPIVVQSMCKTDTRDSKKTLVQIKKLHQIKCQIVRLAIPDITASESFGEIAKKSPLPLVADIHFDHELALACIKNGASKIRFNPGNINRKEYLHELVSACKKAKIPIRIGVNAGSLETKYKSPSPENLVKSALSHASILEKEGFFDICVSIKSSSVKTTIETNRLLSENTDYPIHIGLTESGIFENGSIKSGIALGALLSEGIGDTIRISLTEDPVKEVELAYQILQDLELAKHNRNFISCPACGRNETDHRKVAHEVYKKTQDLPAGLTIAVMGCVVNGPGEAKHADFALIAGKNVYAIYKQGKLIKTVPEKEAVKEFLNIIYA